MSQKEKSDPAGSLIWTFLLSCLCLSAEISMCVREGASASMYLCVCFLLLLSSSCLYSTVPTSCDSVFRLFDIKSYYSLRCRVYLSDFFFFCLSVSLPGCLVLGFFSLCASGRDWLAWCVGASHAQADYTMEADGFKCLCLCVLCGCVRGHTGVFVVSVSSEQSGFNDFGTGSSI